jgi:hypothetical protein
VTTSVGSTRPSRRLWAARALLGLAAVGAVASGLGSIAAVVDAPAGTRVVEAWRALGLLFFGGVFTLLALRPHALRGLWELTLANKILLTVLAAVLGATGAATDAWSTAAADGVLTLLLVVAYVLARGWRAAVGSVSSAWPVLHYDDPAAAHHFLVDVVGFREAVVVHGGLEAGAVYLATDDVDAVHARVHEAGADVVQAPHATEFAAGGPTRAFSVRDPEGNLWTVGTYRGAP